MSLHAHLQVTDLTATFRGDDPDRPVHVGYDGTRVVIVADPRSAQVAAQLIARAATAEVEGDDFDRELWDRVVVDILAAVPMAQPLPKPEQVPALEVVSS